MADAEHLDEASRLEAALHRIASAASAMRAAALPATHAQVTPQPEAASAPNTAELAQRLDSLITTLREALSHTA